MSHRYMKQIIEMNEIENEEKDLAEAAIDGKKCENMKFKASSYSNNGAIFYKWPMSPFVLMDENMSERKKLNKTFLCVCYE